MQTAVTWAWVASEREQLADLADTFTPQQWDTRSLCEAWRVRDVIGHLVDSAEMTTGAAVVGMLKHGFRVDAMLRKEALRVGSSSPDELRARLRAAIPSTRTPPGIKPIELLVDVVVHTQDIRRPLGLRQAIPEEHLRAVADHLKDMKQSLLPGRKRVAGLRLEATDIDWSTGTGPDVRGPAEALVMAMAGRKVALAQLTGDGVDAFASRL